MQRNSSHRHIESSCPVCNNELDAASNIDDATSCPESGDVSICLYCASYLIYDDDLALKLLSEEELLQLPDEIFHLLSRARKAIKKQKENRSIKR